MRRSSKGNPNHWPAGTPKGGQFAPKGKGTEYNRSDEYYAARTRFRNGEITQEELDQIKNPAPSKFVPATSVAEAEKYCRALGVTPYYKGLSLETCNALNESLTVTLTTFPKTSGWLNVCGNAQEINRQKKKDVERYLMEKHAAHFISEERKKNWARRQTSRLVGRVSGRSLAYTYMQKPTGDFAPIQEKYMGIYVNSNNQNISGAMKHCVETKFHPVGCDSVKSVIDHECGHLIHVAYGGKSINMKDKSIKDELSEYAMEDVKEYHAEAWSEFCNNPNPRKRAREIGEEFLRRAGK